MIADPSIDYLAALDPDGLKILGAAIRESFEKESPISGAVKFLAAFDATYPNLRAAEKEKRQQSAMQTDADNQLPVDRRSIGAVTAKSTLMEQGNADFDERAAAYKANQFSFDPSNGGAVRMHAALVKNAISSKAMTQAQAVEHINHRFPALSALKNAAQVSATLQDDLPDTARNSESPRQIPTPPPAKPLAAPQGGPPFKNPSDVFKPSSVTRIVKGRTVPVAVQNAGGAWPPDNFTPAQTNALRLVLQKAKTLDADGTSSPVVKAVLANVPRILDSQS